MRIIDLHTYPNTQEWIACQQPYVDALAQYWGRGWVAKEEAAVVQDFTDAGVEAVLVALDLEAMVAMGAHPLVPFLARMQIQRLRRT